MSEDGSSSHRTGITSDDLTQILTNLLKSQTPNPSKQSLSDNLKISITLNSQNYALWARMIRVAIGGKSKSLLNHLSSNPPDATHESYEQWEQNDLVVFSWLIQNIEPSLASNLTEFPTAKSLWDALVVTYSSGKDKLQLFDLHVKGNEIKQKGIPLEDLWIVLQGIWGEIERRDPNPMKCSVDITTYNRIRGEQKLFQFLNALDHRYDPIKREILRCDPLPSSEGAYATVRKETAHQKIIGAASETTIEQGVAAGLAVTGEGESEGAGFISKGQRRPFTQSASQKQDKSHLKCEHCKKTRHTKEQCFKLVGYPEWWNEGSKRGDVTATNNRGGSSSNSATVTKSSGENTGFGGLMAETKEFFYKSQLSSQGEMETEDSLSWLKQVPSSEEVNHSTNDESLPNIVPSIDISVNNQHPPNLMFEVSNSDTESSSHDETPNPLPAPNHDETATGSTDAKSTTGYYTKVWGNIVTWRSKKQTVVARSSAEAEYRAISQGICELIWIKKATGRS
ncbi:unnamed protein product [Lactuca virosa]|uniref:Retrotransposon Copia-like N-terminal domain-containing protein n=1 Tax=Lactuca virosa TaxID=75947 RepID=A0AAU9N152_9ASTR|nr:unnamed protein product [Lactuca virosa]